MAADESEDNRSSSLPAVTPATNAPNTAPTSVPAFDPESGNTTGKSKPVLIESPIGNTIASGPNLERGDIANDIFRKTSTAASNATKIEVVNMRADKDVEQAKQTISRQTLAEAYANYQRRRIETKLKSNRTSSEGGKAAVRTAVTGNIADEPNLEQDEATAEISRKSTKLSSNSTTTEGTTQYAEEKVVQREQTSTRPTLAEAYANRQRKVDVKLKSDRVSTETAKGAPSVHSVAESRTRSNLQEPDSKRGDEPVEGISSESSMKPPSNSTKAEAADEPMDKEVAPAKPTTSRPTLAKAYASRQRKVKRIIPLTDVSTTRSLVRESSKLREANRKLQSEVLSSRRALATIAANRPRAVLAGNRQHHQAPLIG